MWKQDLPLEPWINTIVTNQIKNQVRNHYGNYVRPCVNCEFNSGDDSCSITASKTQSSECADYRKWEKTKKVAFDLKITVSSEDHLHEMGYSPEREMCFESCVDKLNKYMEEVLSPIHYRAYYMLFFEKASEEDVAKFMGYKISAQKRKLGYRQVKNLKKKFLQVAIEILKDQDIISDGSN